MVEESSEYQPKIDNCQLLVDVSVGLLMAVAFCLVNNHYWLSMHPACKEQQCQSDI